MVLLYRSAISMFLASAVSFQLPQLHRLENTADRSLSFFNGDRANYSSDLTSNHKTKSNPIYPIGLLA